MDAVQEALQDFIKDYCEYLPSEIPRLDKEPTAIEFLNNHVFPSLPCIIKPPDGGYFAQAQKDWNKETILHHKNMMTLMEGSRFVTVAVTPNGRADSITEDKFMVPEERKMSFFQFLQYFERPQKTARRADLLGYGIIDALASPQNLSYVMYVQKQNNNLIEEFSGLLPLLSKDVPLATEAFGCPPEAANIWMGDENSFTSMHKDHYENIYIVVTGTKTFRLFPPISIAWMPYREWPKFQWSCDDFEESYWKKIDLKEEVPWIKPDLQPDTPQKLKMFLSTKSYTVTIKPGEALYLPAMWFHEVSQTHGTIAVNYWYDMRYDLKFPYYCLVNSLGKLSVSRKDASVDIQTELEDKLVHDIMPRLT